MVGFNLGINLKSTGMLAGRAPFTPSIAYPSNLARYDLNFVTQQYLNGIQPLTPNSDDGRFFRQQITPFTPMLSEQADGSILSQAYVGLRIGTSGMWVENDYGINSPILQNRDVSNAAWTKTNCTAAKTRTGRDNVTNAASIVTATAANAVFSQALTVAAGSYTVQVDLGTIAGSGIVEVSTDNFVTTTQITVNAPRYLGVGRYVTPRIAFGLNCTISFRLPSSGDSIHFDWAVVTNRDVELSPHTITTTAQSKQRDRPSTAVIGNGMSSEAHGSGFLDYMAANANWGFYVEWAQKSFLDNSVVVGTNLQVPTGSTDVMRFAPGTGTVTTTDKIQLWPYINKCIAFCVNGRAMICLNGGSVVEAASGVAGPYTTLDHLDIMTNGSGALCPTGVVRRLILLTENLASVTPAMAQAFTS